MGGGRMRTRRDSFGECPETPYRAVTMNEPLWSPGIYLIVKDDRTGLMEVHEWEGCEASDFEGDDPPDGYWYHSWRIEDDGDGGTLGYKSGQSIDELGLWWGFHVGAHLTDEGTVLYDAMLAWIEEVARWTLLKPSGRPCSPKTAGRDSSK